MVGLGGIWGERREVIEENRDSDLQRVIAVVHLAIVIHGLIFFRTPRGLCHRSTFASSGARHCRRPCRGYHLGDDDDGAGGLVTWKSFCCGKKEGEENVGRKRKRG